ncbi:MAG: hypothetical protein JOZ78_10135 [Chroococcidiopsidaceae cyanobacterium CP_BM_ER_R8_30]|nr:hypothetical protein [Chroococcidiopsidaceae cyanobacterium CP_BM_ER_R8_30]
MPYNKQALQTLHSISLEEVDETLKAGKLPTDREEYTDEEIQSSFDVIRGYFNQGIVKDYGQAASMFEEQVNPTQLNESKAQGKGKTSKNGKKPAAKPLDFSELLSLAKELGCAISPREAIKLLEACGLSSDAEQYNQEECDRFLEACDLLKDQGKTYEEIVSHFGAVGEIEIATDMEAATEEVASILDQSGNGLVSEMMRYKAKADVSAAPFQYLGYVAEELGSPEFKENMQRVEELVKGKVEGKSQARTRRILGEMRVIPPSPSPLNALPGAFEDGSTSD